MHELTERFARDRDPAVLDEIGREDVRFHIAIIEAAKSELLKNEIMRLHLINRVLAGANRIQAGAVAVETAQADTDIVAHCGSIQAEHEAIYEAVKQGDAPGGASAMARHLQEIIDSNLESGSPRPGPEAAFDGRDDLRYGLKTAGRPLRGAG